MIVPEEPSCDPVATWRRHVDTWWTAWEEPPEPDGEPRRLYSGPCRDDAVAVAAWHRERTGREVQVTGRVAG